MAGSVTSIILFVLGGILLVRGLPGVFELLASRGWQPVEGTILGSGVQHYATQAGGGHGRAPVSRATVAFSYTVGGNAYTGTRAQFGMPLGYGMGLGGIATAHAERWQPGSQVTVWVDPRDPSNAVLSRSASSSVVITAAGAAAVIAGLLAL